MPSPSRFHLDVPFNRPYATGAEFGYIAEAIADLKLSGNGRFTSYCRAWLEERTTAGRALLTPSCTAALELAALLAGVELGDEVIMPSFTFSSTATAFVLRGATPVFVDIRPDTLNIDEEQVADAITERTRAIVPVHYAGVPAELDRLNEAAAPHGIVLIEDAAHALMSTYRGRAVGGESAFVALSFHETKNVMCGEGGALLINDPAIVARARSCRRRAPTGPVCFEAKSTGTRGSTSARHSCSARSAQRSSGRSSRPRTRSSSAGFRSGTPTMRRSPTSKPTGSCGDQLCRSIARTARTSTTCSSVTRRRATR
jgi:dTDP-4-amino-4,6-dideoxygalactose transaminase